MKIFFKKTIIICLFLITFSGFIQAMAQTAQKSEAEPASVRQVEIIIFSKIKSDALLSEQWSMPPLPNISDAVELTPFEGMVEEKPRELPSSYWKLTNTERKLSKNGYIIILHTAWVQNFSGPSTRIHLISPQAEDSSDNTLMNGIIHITFNRYFNVSVDLLFAEPVLQLKPFVTGTNMRKNFHNIDNGIAYFQLNQRRRMKSNELNYLEHPLFGVLIKITPFSG